MLARCCFTFIGFGIGILTLFGFWFFQFNLTERLVELLQALSAYAVAINQLLVPLLILGVFFCIDLRRHRRRQVELEQMQLYRSMLTSHHHILNNFLNQLQLFRLTAEDTPGFPADELILFDQIIKETLRQLHNLETVTQVEGEDFYATDSLNLAPAVSRKNTLREVVSTFLF